MTPKLKWRTGVVMEGEVGAGRLLPFPVPSGTTTVLVPASLPESVKIGTLTVKGRSLEGEGIYDGDTLICKKAFSRREVTSGAICIVFIPATGELVAKRIVFQEGLVTLRSCAASIADMHFPPDDIDIRGVVIGFQRMLVNGSRKMLDEEIPW